MAKVTTATVARDPSRVSRIAAAAIRLPSDYRIVLLTLALGVITTWWARQILGAAPTVDEVERWGFGLPPIVDGRLWALATGSLMTSALTVPIPIFTLIGVVLYERSAKHWRPAVVLFGGQLIGIVVVSLFLWPWRDSSWTWASDLGYVVDFGISIGGFACLGAWTAYLADPWQRWLRVGLSCYFPGQLVFSGMIYDLAHPVGWISGLLLGAAFAERSSAAGRDPRVTPRTRTVGVIVAVVLGSVAGVVAGMNGGGPGLSF